MISAHQLCTLLGANIKANILKCHPAAQLTSIACLHPKKLSISTLNNKCQNFIGSDGSCSRRLTHTEPNTDPKKSSSSITEVKDAAGQVTIGDKVKQTTKDAYYTSIIIGGVAITGIIFYTIFKELFSRETPNGIYSEAFSMCKKNSKIVDAVGEPITGHGETTSRGRRRHVSHVEFEHDGVKCMRMRFYIKGARRKGTVHLEVKKNDRNKYEYRYLFVELDGYPNETIILQDNR